MQTHDQTDNKYQQNDISLNYIISSKCTGGNCVGVAKLADGSIKIRNTSDDSGKPITFTREEWVAFIAGVKEGEFNV